MEIIIVLLLIILNGIFAMAEMSIVSARKSKLQKQAQDNRSILTKNMALTIHVRQDFLF